MIIKIDFIGLRHWGYWMFIPAFFIYIGAFTIYFKNKRLKNTVLGAIKSYQDDRVSIDDLSSETLITKNNILRILMDLRAENKVKYRYDSQNGDIILGNASKIEKKEKTEDKTEKKLFCPYCRAPVSTNDKFCYKFDNGKGFEPIALPTELQAHSSNPFMVN